MTAAETSVEGAPVAQRALVRGGSWRQVLGRSLRRNPTIVIGGGLLLLLVLSAVLAPVLAPANPTQAGFSTRVRPPSILGTSSGFVLGSDNLGRDILSRVLYGGQLSLSLAAASVVLSGIIGVAAGLVSGYVGGRVDDAIMRIVDVQLAFPVILLAIAVVAVIGTSTTALIGVLALSGWVIYARTVRANVLSVKEQEYVGAARALGAGDVRIVLLHVLPNTMAPIIVVATVQLATMLLLESGLSFLGLGIQPPTPSWGRMLAEGRDYLSNAWWISTVPGIAISLAVLGANLLGDGLRDVLDPNLRGM
ncbi:MAG TPA: ABC transporter permease [Chloroflexota bacterium]|nr:ABC transporter permease [Chloroflexota bacterium]